MPTALLPAIGASIRSEWAASAIARSSDSASIRLSLMSGAGLDLVLGHDRAGVASDDPGRDPEAGQLLDDDLLVPCVHRLVAAGMEWDRHVLEDRDRRQDVLDAVLGQRRIAAVGDVVRVTQRAAPGRRRVADAAAPPTPRAGANVFEVWPVARNGGRDHGVVVAPRSGLAGRWPATATTLPFDLRCASVPGSITGRPGRGLVGVR